MKCKFLDGENIAPRTVGEARALIGKRLQYLRTADIDHSGRGYYSTRYGTITQAAGRNVCFDDTNWMLLREIFEAVEANQ